MLDKITGYTIEHFTLDEPPSFIETPIDIAGPFLLDGLGVSQIVYPYIPDEHAGPKGDAKPNGSAGGDETRSEAPYRLPIFAASDLAGIDPPPRVWHVPDIIPGRTVTIMNGDGGTGKSLLGKQLSVATALGTSWLGIFINQGPCLFLTAEDDTDEVHRRLVDIVRETGEGLEKLRDLHVVSLAGLDALMAVPDVKTKLLRPTAVFESLKSEIARIRPTLIVLDTLADIFGGEENQRAQARQFIGMLRGIAIENNCAVLLLAHPSLSGMASGSGSSGSTGWNNSVRSRLYLERVKGDDGIEGDPDVRVLKVKKSNYSRADVEIELRWQHGIFVAPSDAGTGSSFFRKAAAEEKADRIFLDMLAEFEAEGRHVSSSKTAANAAPAAFAGSPRAQGIKKQAFKSAMERLFASKKIRNHEFGSPSRPRSRIVLARPE